MWCFVIRWCCGGGVSLSWSFVRRHLQLYDTVTFPRIPNWPWTWPCWNYTTSYKFSVSVKKIGEGSCGDHHWSSFWFSNKQHFLSGGGVNRGSWQHSQSEVIRRRPRQVVKKAKCLVIVGQHHCGQTFGTQPWRRPPQGKGLFFPQFFCPPSIVWGKS